MLEKIKWLFQDETDDYIHMSRQIAGALLLGAAFIPWVFLIASMGR